MIEGSIARRYALALFDLAQAKSEVDRIARELDQIQSLVRASTELKVVLANETIPARQKKEALGAALPAGTSRYVRNFLFLLVDKHRETHLGDIVRGYHGLADEARGVVEVEMRTAVELPQPVVEDIRAGIAGRLGKTVKLAPVVQRSLIGGVVLRIGDQLLDGSLKGRLQRLKRRMAQA